MQWQCYDDVFNITAAGQTYLHFPTRQGKIKRQTLLAKLVCCYIFSQTLNKNKNSDERNLALEVNLKNSFGGFPKFIPKRYNFSQYQAKNRLEKKLFTSEDSTVLSCIS